MNNPAADSYIMQQIENTKTLKNNQNLIGFSKTRDLRRLYSKLKQPSITCSAQDNDNRGDFNNRQRDKLNYSVNYSPNVYRTGISSELGNKSCQSSINNSPVPTR